MSAHSFILTFFNHTLQESRKQIIRCNWTSDTHHVSVFLTLYTFSYKMISNFLHCINMFTISDHHKLHPYKALPVSMIIYNFVLFTKCFLFAM